MKFLHTADWQIGMKAAHVGEKAAKEIRRVRLEAARRVGSIAKERDVDFILIAGDLFEDNGIEGVLIQQVADIIDSAGVPVYIIPGNHDPLVPGSVWEHPAWSGARHIQILKKTEPVETNDAVLFPCPIYNAFSTTDPTAWIDATEEDKICIGLAHGTVEGVKSDEYCFPIPRDAVEKRGLDYLALGHWHSKCIYTTSDEAYRMAYSGTHEPTKFGELDSGNILIVEIKERGALPVIESVETGILKWYKLEKEVRTPSDLESILKEIEEWKDTNKTLIRLALKGVLTVEAAEWLTRLEELMKARFLYGCIEDSGLMPSPNDDTWINAIPAGYLRNAALELRDKAASGGEEAEIARIALMELYRISQEVGR